MGKPESASGAKRHHFVPRFLLGNFVDDRDKINVYDKKKLEKRRQSTREVAYEKYLYVYKGDDGTSKDFEGLLSKVDDWGSAAIRTLTDTKALSSLDQENKTKLAYFVGTMLIRTPQTRRRMLAMNQHMISKWGPDIRYDGTDHRLGNMTEQDARNATIQMIAQATPDLAKRLREKIWLLVESPVGSSFYISDNPITLHNLIERPFRGNLGLSNEGIEIYLPLTPRLSLVMMCPIMANRAKDFPEIGIKEAYFTDTPVQYRPENVTHLNSLQVINADRYLFSGDDNFTLAEEMTSTHPDLRNGTGMRYFTE